MAEDATAVFGVKREAEEIGVRTGELCLKKLPPRYRPTFTIQIIEGYKVVFSFLEVRGKK